MSRICPLFSGSSGNCTYIGQGDAHILIDVGVSAKRICQRLGEIGVDFRQISAIFITHEHNDHIKGLETLTKKYNLPIYMSQGTADAISEFCSEGVKNNIKIIDKNICVDGIEVLRFATSHDCVDSSGYRVNLGERSFAVCTDTGVVTDEIRKNLEGCELVLLESNHDLNMLRMGPYPLQLKRRILADNGHLSNVSCANELPNLVKKGTMRFILGHLSRQNNTDDSAYNEANTALNLAGFTEGLDYILYIAPPEGGKLISL